MQSDAILVKVVGQTGTVILNRPDAGNALTRSMVRGLADILDDLYYEKRVRAIVLTGAGDAFCEGDDLDEVQSNSEQPDAITGWGEEATAYRDLLERMLEITKPIIAAVNGPAISSGAGLVAASDIVVAGESARFSLPDVRRGLVAGAAAPLLCARIGSGLAGKLLLTGEALDAAAALRLNLFHELAPDDKVWARATELGEACAAGAPEAVQLTKRLLSEVVAEGLSTQLSAGAAMSATARTTEAAREGIAAHLEGREPEWP